MEPSIAQLQAEIERQQVIIVLLIEKNQALESQLANAYHRLETDAPTL